MKTNRLQVILLIALVITCTVAVYRSAKDSHNHGWGKWEDSGKVFHNEWGNPCTEQSRHCTNCGYIQIEVH